MPDKSLFEQMDDLSKQISDLSLFVHDKLENEKQTNIIDNKPKQTIQFNLTEFIVNSKKSFRWWGSDRKFNIEKILLCLAYLIVIVLGIVSTIFTSKIVGAYSPASFFENLWLLFACIIMVNVFTLTPEINDITYEKKSTSKFSVNKVGLHYSLNKSKTIYFIFFILAIICSIFNVGYAFSKIGTANITLCVVFEVLFIVSLFLSSFFKNMFTSGYDFAVYQGRGPDNKIIKLIHDPLGKKIMPYDEFVNKFLRFM